MVIEDYHDVDSRGRVGLFLCECGCGEEFFAHYKTRRPQYASKTHRARAYRARASSRVYAQRIVDCFIADGGNPEHATDEYNARYAWAMEYYRSRNRGRM